MSDARERVMDFILKSEGEIKGFAEASNLVEESKQNNYQNAVQENAKASYTIRSLNNVGETVDVSLLNLDLKNSENLIGDFFEVIRNIRASIAREISNASKAAGVSQGKYEVLQDVQTTFAERIVSTESMIKNQKDLLAQVTEGKSPGSRKLGERPVSMKAQRTFEEITKDQNEESDAPNVEEE